MTVWRMRGLRCGTARGRDALRTVARPQRPRGAATHITFPGDAGRGRAGNGRARPKAGAPRFAGRYTSQVRARQL